MHKARVPAFEDLGCQCGSLEETPRHIVVFCLKYLSTLAPRGLSDYNGLLSTNLDNSKEMLPQFSLAKEFLY